jgi:hypothetical protein
MSVCQYACLDIRPPYTSIGPQLSISRYKGWLTVASERSGALGEVNFLIRPSRVEEILIRDHTGVAMESNCVEREHLVPLRGAIRDAPPLKDAAMFGDMSS